jgi:hypothetical protein
MMSSRDSVLGGRHLSSARGDIKARRAVPAEASEWRCLSGLTALSLALSAGLMHLGDEFDRGD